MSELIRPLSRETVVPQPKQPLGDRLRLPACLVAAFALGASLLYYTSKTYDRRHRYDVPLDAVGLIRPPERWNDPDVVTYRSWEADCVIVAVAPPGALAAQASAGTRCYVRGATVVRVVSAAGGDALLMIAGHADDENGADLNAAYHGDIGGFVVDSSRSESIREPGDCPDGTMFVAGADQARRMIVNERIREMRWEADRELIRRRLGDSARLCNLPF